MSPPRPAGWTRTPQVDLQTSRRSSEASVSVGRSRRRWRSSVLSQSTGSTFNRRTTYRGRSSISRRRTSSFRRAFASRYGERISPKAVSSGQLFAMVRGWSAEKLDSLWSWHWDSEGVDIDDSRIAITQDLRLLYLRTNVCDAAALLPDRPRALFARRWQGTLLRRRDLLKRPTTTRAALKGAVPCSCYGDPEFGRRGRTAKASARRRQVSPPSHDAGGREELWWVRGWKPTVFACSRRAGVSPHYLSFVRPHRPVVPPASRHLRPHDEETSTRAPEGHVRRDAKLVALLR